MRRESTACAYWDPKALGSFCCVFNEALTKSSSFDSVNHFQASSLKGRQLKVALGKAT